MTTTNYPDKKDFNIPNKSHLNKRLLVTTYPSHRPSEITITEISPSGKWVCYHHRGKAPRWKRAENLNVEEILPDLIDKK